MQTNVEDISDTGRSITGIAEKDSNGDLICFRESTNLSGKLKILNLASRLIILFGCLSCTQGRLYNLRHAATASLILAAIRTPEGPAGKTGTVKRNHYA